MRRWAGSHFCGRDGGVCPGCCWTRVREASVSTTAGTPSFELNKSAPVVRSATQ